jgi:DNA-binding transcriptional MocR family regulator
VNGLRAAAGDGLNVWVELPASARAVSEQLMRRGWLARTGDEFHLDSQPSRHLRLTVHDLSDDDRAQLVADLTAAVAAAR